MGAIKREMNSGKWTAFAIGYQCLLAYVVSLMVYQFGCFFTGAFEGGIQTLWLILAVACLVFSLYMLFRPAKRAEKIKENGK